MDKQGEKMKQSLSFLILIFGMSLSLYAEDAKPAAENPSPTSQEEGVSKTETDIAMEPAVSEDETEADVDLESDYTFGTVSRISESEIVIREFDDAKGEEVEMAHHIPKDVEWENVQNWQDVASGDYAEIDYTLVNNARVASFISVESMKEENGAVPS